MQWQHSLPLKTAKRKVDESVDGPAAKISKETKNVNFKCDTCGHTTGYKYNLKRHMELYKHKELEVDFYESFAINYLILVILFECITCCHNVREGFTKNTMHFFVNKGRGP